MLFSCNLTYVRHNATCLRHRIRQNDTSLLVDFNSHRNFFTHLCTVCPLVSISGQTIRVFGTCGEFMATLYVMAATREWVTSDVALSHIIFFYLVSSSLSLPLITCLCCFHPFPSISGLRLSLSLSSSSLFFLNLPPLILFNAPITLIRLKFLKDVLDFSKFKLLKNALSFPNINFFILLLSFIFIIRNYF